MFEAMDEGFWEDDILDPETCGTSSLYLPMGKQTTRPYLIELTVSRSMGTREIPDGDGPTGLRGSVATPRLHGVDSMDVFD